MRILLVEDDDLIAKPLAKDIRYQNHIIEVVSDGITGWEYAQSNSYDLILLDLMLPRLDGITLCKRLRAAGCTAFILMLTARDTTTDKVIGLDAGADDYLVKPFDLEELAARIRALSRRSLEVQTPILNRGNLRLNPSCRTVFYKETLLSLTPKEYMILECLMKNSAQVFTRSVLLDKLWEFDRSSGEETIKTHITNLRRKLKDAGCSETVIATVHGIGYRFAIEGQ
ncbi:MAG: response regulator transcription factor [Leptolyngbya sp. UWPOB_LEPTO1]|uniref:response regulator transcription factor n=1 Tax=Leptolyngbya sp. UWPOB_LEPTO1 TaxID=2815653 RepID=UPI001AC863DF|nr:response regulator transcription factor [Leptolyngbya sp. UWPOB_LEPTO1]MBN8560160.1 response regulator transcription factor [Leptolyngbya sp. UWPOB_LEPTO1]